METSNLLITGGARGIGAGIVRQLAAAGHNVAFCGRKDDPAFHQLADQIAAEFKVGCRYFQCDVSHPDDRVRLIESFVREFGSLDGLINNAGVAPEVRADLLDMSAESFDRVMGINLRGPFFLTQLAAKEMMKAPKEKFRCIVNIGSVSADYASINRGEYCLSKAAIAMSTKLFAVRLADEGICVYEIRPGVIKTDMTGTVAAKYDKMIAEGLTLQRRWGYPEDIGKAVAALVSGAFGYSTGQVVNVDGGLSILRF